MRAIVRPAGGIKPRFISSVVSATSKRDIKRENQIYWRDFL